MLASVVAIKGTLTLVVRKYGSKFGEHETIWTQNQSFCVFGVFVLTTSGRGRQCLCIVCDRSSDENRRTILQPAARSQPDTRFEANVSKQYLLGRVPGFLSACTRGGNGFSRLELFNATECRLPTYEGSFCCGKISDSRLKQKREDFF